MSYVLRALTRADCEAARTWRNTEASRPMLRTPYVLTPEMQNRFYDDVVCDPRVPHRFWAVVDTVCDPDDSGALEAIVGLTNIEWENGHAELSLLHDGDGDVAEAAVRLALREAFERLRLLTVFAECYTTDPERVDFFVRLGERRVRLPRRKWWHGQLWDSVLVAFTAETWRERPEPEAAWPDAETLTELMGPRP